MVAGGAAMSDMLWLPHLVGLAVGLVLLSWALGRWLLRLVERLLTPLWRNRALHLPGLLLVLPAAVLGIWGLVALWHWLYDLFGPAFAAEGFRAWLQGFVRDALAWITAVASTGSGAWSILDMLRRWRRLIPTGPFEAPAPPLGPAPPRNTPGRRIVICCDGTGNRPDETQDGQPAPTNVWKLYRSLVCNEAQTTWYVAGVGTGTSSTAREAQTAQMLLRLVGAGTAATVASIWKRLVALYEAGFGAGITETISLAYTEIVRQYRPGDRICIIGFSRGAYAARCVAGVIRRCGLLKSGNILYASDVVQLYVTRRDPDSGVPLDPALLWPDVDVEFLGVFDTVAALGAPLWGWWFNIRAVFSNRAYTTDPAPICRGVYHAMAMDERRAQFFPTPFAAPDPTSSWTDSFEQVWFRGAHGDVGGGYADASLSDIALGWMMDRAVRHGLVFHRGAYAALHPAPLGRLHDELQRRPSWGLVGSWPRWSPVPGDPPMAGGVPGLLHPSVLRRAVISTTRLNRPDLLRPAPGVPLEFWTEAHRMWDRTGFVIESGAAYRITWLDGMWRDAGEPPCGPAGQKATGFDHRRLLFWRRRLPQADWMTLCATVAHKRVWPLRELGIGKLLRYLFWRDPWALREQVAPIGRSLRQPMDALCLVSEAPAGGLLYLFANDWWQMATCNSGSLKLRIERLEEPDPTLPLWRLRPDGHWDAPP